MDLLLKAENQINSSALLIPSTPRYISVFKIDGEPILPPLMTTEKRIEMQMYREKAIQLERKFLTQQQNKRVQFYGEDLASPRSQFNCSFGESTSHRSIEGYDNRQTESEISFSMPFCQTEDKQESPMKMYTNCGSNTDPTDERPESVIDNSTNTVQQSIKERMKNLKKSKTIVCDYSLCTLVKPINEEKMELENVQKETKGVEQGDFEEKANLNYLQPKKSLHLPLQSIPSICVNPPTPLAGPINICDTLSATESVDSFDISGFHSSQATQNQAAEIPEDTTDDTSSSQSTENMRITLTKQITGISARILQFEQLENETTPQRLENEEDNLLEKGFVLKPPQRSATSPSLKSLNDIDLNSLTPSPRTEEGTSSHSLVRSSSFTLEGPSKALLDHIRQQRSQTTTKSNDVSPHSHRQVKLGSTKRRATPSPSAWRDTVESKAKRVQKKVDTKSNSRPMSSTRSKSKSTLFNNFYNPTTQSWDSKLPPMKLKRSPYDAKGTPATSKPQTKTNSTHKNVTPNKLQTGHAIKKSVSNTTYTIKQPSMRKSLPNNSISHSITENIDAMSEIESRHHQRLLALIAQQQDEQRRLQHAFETQQNLLLEQLNNEISRVHIDGQQSTSTTANNPKSILHIEDGSKGQPLSPHNRSINIASPATPTSPTISVAHTISSYVSPTLGGTLGGFTTTTTLSPCEMPATCITPPHYASSRSPSQRRTQVGISTGIYADNISHSIGITALGDSMISPISHKRASNTIQKVRPDQNKAATLINAYARGFLIRRLFQTEQIQRIVQTIRDTLIFVLNLHMETIENAEEADAPTNIKLKARLLQQLASASRTLHLIFFQTSTKERMEIISRDRKRIKTKLLTMNLKRSPRIA